MAFFEEMRHFFIFFIVFGLWSSWKNFEYKRVLIICTISSIAIVIIAASLAVYLDQFLKFTTLSNTVSNSLYAMMFLTHLIIVLESRLQYNRQMQLIQTISSVDEQFYTKLGIRIRYKIEKKQMFIRLMFIFSIEIIIKFLVFAASAYWFIENEFFYVILYSNALICLRPLQVSFFIHLLLTRLKLIHKELIDIRNIQSNLIDHNEVTVTLHNATASVYDRLLSLKHIYRELFHVCELISTIFGWSLLIIVIYIFAVFTFECYWTFLFISHPIQTIICLMFTMPFVITLGTLAYYCSECAHQVRYQYYFLSFNVYKSFCFFKSRTVEKWLHRIPMSLEHFFAVNDLVREFALEVNHSRFCITAFGFFELNLDLMGSVSDK